MVDINTSGNKLKAKAQMDIVGKGWGRILYLVYKIVYRVKKVLISKKTNKKTKNVINL